MRTKFDFGIELEDTAHGLLVRQYDEAYVARNWRLTSSVVELVETCLGSGLRWMIRTDHPRRNSRWPNPRGVVYLAFSPTEDDQWSLAIDSWRSNRDDYGRAVFNGKYQTQFFQHDIPFDFEKRNKGDALKYLHQSHPRVQLLRVYGSSEVENIRQLQACSPNTMPSYRILVG